MYPTHLNSSLPTTVFPSIWKEAEVIALLKEGNRLDIPKSFPDPSMARFTSSVEKIFVTCSAPNITGGKIHR